MGDERVRPDWAFLNKNPAKRRRLFLLSLYQKGINIGGERISELRTFGYIKDGDYTPKKEKQLLAVPLNEIKSAEAVQADKHINVLIKGQTRLTYTFITTENWKPDSLINHSEDFVRWIDSINSGFRNRCYYNKFDIYCQQAEQWIAQDYDFARCKTEREQFEFAIEEAQRIQQNSLYFLDKYLKYKSGSSGKDYKSFPAQKTASFLIDSGYCLMFGKGRQIWFSTTIGGIAIKRINFNRSYFVKFIAENLIKSQEIFNDKIKFPFYHLPDWLKSSVGNDQDGLFRLLFKGLGKEKGNVSGADSKIQVETPYVTAINGGSPDLVLLDEIGQINLLGEIIGQGRPTLYEYDHTTGKLEQKRQFCAWGTSGNTERGGAEFEIELTSAMEAWQSRDFEYGIIPVVFDFWARAGMTQDFYDKEKKRAYEKGKKEEKYIVMFHQHYPTGIHDMFLSSSETVLPISTINICLQNSRKVIPRRGYFEPIYDKNRKNPERSYVPYAIVGTTFIPTPEDYKAPVTMIRDYEPGWLHRNFQGTDPINSQSGHSYLSSAIWDSHIRDVPCLLNSRTMDYRYEYLQATLMNIHYGYPPHLIEMNVGRELVNFIDLIIGTRTIVLQSQLPPSLQTSSNEIYGIKKIGANTPFIHNRLIEMLESYKDNISIDEFWIQLKTFIKKDSAKKADVAFAVNDYRKQRDDVIYGILYSYICAQCYSHKNPVKIGEETEKKKKRNRYICNAETGWATVLSEQLV